MKLYVCEKEDALTLDEYLEKEGEEELNLLLNYRGFWNEYFKDNEKELHRINKIIEKKEKYEIKAKKKIRQLIKKNKRKCVEIE